MELFIRSEQQINYTFLVQNSKINLSSYFGYLFFKHEKLYFLATLCAFQSIRLFNVGYQYGPNS